nr:hypothetical protein [Myxococcota bacterium]
LLDFTCGDLLNWVFSVVFKPRIPSDDGAPQAFISLLSYEGYATWGYISSETGNDEQSIMQQNQNSPLRTLYKAQKLIESYEVSFPENVTEYFIYLKGGERFEPQNYTRVDFEHGTDWNDSNFDSPSVENCEDCMSARYHNRHRAAFLWSHNKPLTLTSYGNERAILSGSQDYDGFSDSCCIACNRTCIEYQSVRVQLAVVINAFWNGTQLDHSNQRTTISDIHFANWEMGAIYLHKTKDVHIKRNLFQRIGTYYFPEERFIVPEKEKAVEGGPDIGDWPIYAGGAISIVRSQNVDIGATVDSSDSNEDANYFRDIHNRDDRAHPTVDKLHAIYNIASKNVGIRNNRFFRTSGPPLTIRNASININISGNILEQAAPSDGENGETHLFEGVDHYVQQGFYRVHCSAPENPSACPNNVEIKGNTTHSPFCWDLMRNDGDASTCFSLEASEYSGSQFVSPSPPDAGITYTGNSFQKDYKNARLALDSPAFTLSGFWYGDRHLRFLTWVDNDSFMDLVGFWDNGILVSYSNENGNFSNAQVELNYFGYHHGWRNNRHLRFVEDIDGDGDGDILAIGDNHIYFAERSESGYIYRSRILENKFGYNDGWRIDKHVRVLADLDTSTPGIDVVGFGDNGVYIATWDNDTNKLIWRSRVLSHAFSYDDAWRVSKHLRFVSDIDGDGKADIVGIADDGIWFAKGTGTGFQSPSLHLQKFGYDHGWKVDLHPRVLADFDGDGDIDIIGFGDNGVYLSRWDESINRFVWGSSVSSQFGYNESWRTDQHLRYVSDVNADGYADIVAFGNKDAFVAYGNGISFDLSQKFAIDGYSYENGYTIEDHPRLLGNIDDDPWLEVVAIDDSRTYSLSP